jgi:hypothetical protein
MEEESALASAPGESTPPAPSGGGLTGKSHAVLALFNHRSGAEPPKYFPNGGHLSGTSARDLGDFV